MSGRCAIPYSYRSAQPFKVFSSRPKHLAVDLLRIWDGLRNAFPIDFTQRPFLTTAMLCSYCGLESSVATNHASTGECIAALRIELIRLEHLLDRRHGRIAGRTAVSDSRSAAASQLFEADRGAQAVSSDAQQS
jgi:hypothetical protein